MPSGNFIVGRNLSLEGFRKYVQMPLRERGLDIRDVFDLRKDMPDFSNDFGGESILFSVKGPYSHKLEDSVREIMLEADKILVKKRDTLAHSNNFVSDYADGSKKVNIKVEGTYIDDNAASLVFCALVNRYLIESSQVRLARLNEQIKMIGEKLTS